MRQQQMSLADFPAPETTRYELQVLADCITRPELMATAIRLTKPEMFGGLTRPGWDTLARLHEQRKAIDWVTFSDNTPAEVWRAIMPAMQYATNQDATFLAHLDTLATAYCRKMIYLQALQALQATRDNTITLDELFALPGKFQDQLASGMPQADSGKTTAEIMAEFTKHLAEELAGGGRAIPTGFEYLDKITQGGFKPGQLVIVAARPSVGKSVTMLQMATAAAAAGHPATVFSLEMTNEELAKRMLLASDLEQRAIMAGDWDKINQVKDPLAELPISWYDKPVKVSEILATIETRHQMGQADAVYIDYLGLIDGPSGRTKAEELGAITTKLKRLAKALEIPIVLLCQLNRDSEKDNRDPRLSDLRDSGNIEQDADIVLMLQRDSNPEGNEDTKVVRLLLVKNRNGKAWLQIHMHPNESYSRFFEYACTEI